MNESSAFLLFSMATVAAAGYVRGYGGFGFSMITVAALSFFYTPAQVVPVVLLLEVAASLFLLPGAWPSVAWPVLSWMLLGVCLGTPLGVWLLAGMSPPAMKMAVAAIIFMLALLLRRGFAVVRQLNRPETIAAGVAAGVLNGAAAIGGPPAILFFLDAVRGRGVPGLVDLFFMVTDILAAGACIASGLLTPGHAGRALILALPMTAGLFLGKRSFLRTSETRFRKRALLFLMWLSGLMLVRAVYEVAA